MKNLLILLLVTIITGYVTRVKDGDSFLMRSKGVIYEIRLYGVDAPEYRQKGGKAAKKALRGFISGKTIKVESTSIGKYNRVIGKVYIGKKYVNLELVKNGFVHWYQRYAPSDKDLAAAQQLAKTSKSGIWSTSTPPVNPEKYRHGKKPYTYYLSSK
jgi:endonuclease YncB( thermonuclease family)